MLIVWHIDHLERSISYLVGLVEDLRERGEHLSSLGDGMIDTGSALGISFLTSFPRSLNSSDASFKSGHAQGLKRQELGEQRAGGN
jgi:hypothetical protein